VSVRYQIKGSGAAEISAHVEAGVRAGALPPGTLLPPVRTLAADLGVAPATVATAYRSLRQRGLVETAGRNGTRVRPQPPVAIQRRAVVPDGTVDLASGHPDATLLPRLGPHLRRLAQTGGEPVGYRESGPWPELVELGSARLAADGVPVPAGTVTSGTLDAIERLLSAHLRPGDRVGVEDPGWANLFDLVAALGLDLVSMPVDDDGPTPDGLGRALRAGVAAVVVTVRAQNPTGAAVSADRAAALRPLLAAHPDVLVIEDDHAAELAEVPLHPLAGAGRSWAFVRSLSKPYGPDLRVAVLSGDEASIARVQGRMRLGAGWVSTVLQRLVVELWRDGSVSSTVDRARVEYASRRVALLAALADRGVPARGRSGINIWIPVPDESSAVSGLRERGWAVAPGSLYRLATPPGLRVTVSGLRRADIERFADDVASALALDDPAPTGLAR
jgi:DNA-binding transcriptional MocR family regulator